MSHGGRTGDIAIHGRESNHTPWRPAMMNQAVRRPAADLRWNSEGSLRKDARPDLRAPVLANPPFNVGDRGGERIRDDAGWRRHGPPPAGNATFARLQHILRRPAPTGTAGVILADGSLPVHAWGSRRARPTSARSPAAPRGPGRARSRR